MADDLEALMRREVEAWVEGSVPLKMLPACLAEAVRASARCDHDGIVYFEEPE